MNDTKEVNYAKHCPLCRYWEDEEGDPDSPCWDCLNQGFNIDSHRPIKYEAKVTED